MNKRKTRNKDEEEREKKKVNRILADSVTLDLSTSHPQDIDNIIFTLNESVLPPEHPYFLSRIDCLLRPFEDEAKAILKGKGYSIDLQDLERLESDHTRFRPRIEGGWDWYCDLDLPTLNARRLLLSAHSLKQMIADNRAEDAALEMMRVVFAAVSAKAGKHIEGDIKLFVGKGTGGSRPKDKEGIKLAIGEVLKKIKVIRPTPQVLWDYFKKHYREEDNAMPIGDYKIYYSKSTTDEEDVDRIYQLAVITGRLDAIKFETFRKYLHPKAKKSTLKKSGK